MKKDILVELIDLLYRFEEDGPAEKEYTLQDFVGFLNAHVGARELAMRKIEGDRNPDVQKLRQESHSDAGILITLMYRYAKGYVKKALKGSPIQTADEFAFLITLLTHESLTKTELINKQIMEKTSGVEVIKRLVTQKMMREFADETDGRSVRVAITPKGQMELAKVLPEMGKVSKIVVGNLSEAEINTLSFLLKKLDFFHNDIYVNKRTLGLDQLLSEVK